MNRMLRPRSKFLETVVLLAVAIFVTGLAGAVFSLARQAYLTETVPVRIRARALSTLGGTFRVGLFVGPFVGAALVSGRGIGTAYAFAAAMSLAAAVLTAFLPDVTRTRRAARAGTGEPRQQRVAPRVLVDGRAGVAVEVAIRTFGDAERPMDVERQRVVLVRRANGRTLRGKRGDAQAGNDSPTSASPSSLPSNKDATSLRKASARWLIACFSDRSSSA